MDKLKDNEEYAVVDNAGVPLSAVWTHSVPSIEKKGCLAILMHGGPEGHKDGPEKLFVKMAQMLAALGIDSVRFDFEGQGESGGDYVSTTMARQCNDFRAVYTEAEKRGYSKFSVVGESFGATCALGVYQSNFAAVVLLWPCIYLLDVCFAPFYEEPYKSQLLDLGYIIVGKDKVGPDLLNELVEVDNLEDEVRHIQSPVLLIHGDADSEVPYTQSQRAYDILHEPKRLIIVPNADHCLRRPLEQELVLNETCAWLKEHFSK